MAFAYVMYVRRRIRAYLASLFAEAVTPFFAPAVFWKMPIIIPRLIVFSIFGLGYLAPIAASLSIQGRTPEEIAGYPLQIC